MNARFLPKYRAAFGICALFVALAALGRALAPYDPHRLDLRASFAAPSTAHWLGTADNGVDLLSALLYGAQRSAIVALSTVALSLSVGVLIGVVAAVRGGTLDFVLMTVADWVQSFPGLVLNVAIFATVKDPNLWHLVGALSLHGWVLFARLARAEALTIRSTTFIEAAHALGIPGWRVWLFHFIPNLAAPQLVQASNAVGHVIIAESTLSFLGVGPSSSLSWGLLLDQGLGVLLVHPHITLITAGLIAVVALAFNVAGDGLRKTWLLSSGS